MWFFLTVYTFTAICQTWVLSKSYCPLQKAISVSVFICQSHTLWKPYSGHLVDRWILCLTSPPPDFFSALQGPSFSIVFLGQNGFSTVSEFILFIFSFSPNSHFSFHQFQFPTSRSHPWVLRQMQETLNKSQ